MEGNRIVFVMFTGFLEFLRDLSLGISKNDTRLTLSFRLSLHRHRILQT